jgi:hypothetical protein
MSSIAQNPNQANVRLTFGDIDTERRTPPLARNTEMERQFTRAMQAVERLLSVCHQAGIAPSLVTREREFYAGQIDQQAAFYGDEDGEL